MRRYKYSLEFFRKIVEAKGGEILSTKYNPRQIQVKCIKHNHTWNTRSDTLLAGSWCWFCGKDRIRTDLTTIQKLATERGGKCLSKQYDTCDTLLEWECFNGHQFKAKYGDVNRGHWCQQCSGSISERVCREYFEQLFGKPFPKQRPKFLKGLELDGYCEELGIAFEHNGEQHYKLTNFTRSKHMLKAIKNRDRKKQRLCRKHGVLLIIIPQLYKKTKPEHIKLLIKRKLEANPRALFAKLAVDWNKEVVLIEAYKGNNFYYERLRTAALKFNGELLSTTYINASHELLFFCRTHNLSFKAIPNVVILGSWGCPKCRSEKHSACLIAKKTIEDMKNLAKTFNGDCLSTAYLGCKIPLTWHCFGCERVWKREPAAILLGYWCASPACMQSYYKQYPRKKRTGKRKSRAKSAQS